MRLPFVCAQARALGNSFSLNNIKQKCEMISDGACCLSLRCVSWLSQHLITRTLLCCQENAAKKERQELSDKEQRRSTSLGCEDNSARRICGDDSPGTGCGFLPLIE